MADTNGTYDYFASAHLGFCYGPVDQIRALQVRKNFTVWAETLPRLQPAENPGLTGGDETTTDGSTGPIVTNEALWFDLPLLFGEGRGGVRGLVEFYLGSATQSMSDRLADAYGKTPSTAPGFRNTCMLYFVNFWWGRFNDGVRPNVGDVRIQVTRMPKGLDPALAEIPVTGTLRYEVNRATGLDAENTNTVECPHPPDANPAHVAYEILTNRDFGMGLSAANVDLQSFEDAANVFRTEGLGVSFVWNGTVNVDAILTDLAEVTQSLILVNKRTGKWEMRPLRGGYDVNDPNIPTINQDNAVLTSYSTTSCTQLANEVQVRWTDPLTGRRPVARAQDTAGINGLGRVVSLTRDYYMVSNLPTAYKLAWRDLRQVSHARKQVVAQCSRALSDVQPGDIVRLDWPEYELSNVIFRVLSVNRGTKGNMPVTITMMEDVFSFDTPDQAAIPQPVWDSTLTTPTPMDTVRVMDTPKFMAPDDAEGEVRLTAFGLDAATDCSGFVLARQDSAGEYEHMALLTQADHATTAADLVSEAESDVVVGTFISNFEGYIGPELNNAIIFGDPGGDHEIAIITAYDSATDTMTLTRGAYDTLPKAWPTGTDMWFLNKAVDVTVFTRTFSGGDAETLKALTKTGLGVLNESAAPDIPHTVDDRPGRPIRPANIVTRGVAWPDTATLDVDEPVAVSWANRNRITEVENPPAPKWTDPDVTPEAGQVTKVDLLDSDGATILETYTSPEGATTLSIPTSKMNGPGMRYLRFYADRGGVVSFSKPTQGLNVTVSTGMDCSETGLQNLMANAYVHLKPDDSALVTLSGGKVTNITDPWSLHDMDSTDGPTYVDQINSLNVLTFNSDRLKLPWDGTADEMTIAIVFTTTNTQSKSNWWDSPILFGREKAGYVRDFGLVVNNGHLSFVAGSASGQNDGTAVVNDGNPHLAIVRWKTDGTFEVRVDGNVDASGTTGTGTRDAMTEVYWGYSGGSAFVGQVAETLLWNTWATDGRAQQLEGYLAHKWGLTLPAGHPYETETPCS